MEHINTRSSPRKMSSLPLPWCTSKSISATRCRPCTWSAWRMPTATLLKKQKPMAAAQLLLSGQRRVVGVHVVQQPLDQQHVVDGAQALRAFGVVGPHLMAGAVRVRDKGRQHAVSSVVVSV